MKTDFDDETPTVQIPRETMMEARERSAPAHVGWTCADGHLPAGPDRPTRDIRVPTELVEPEVTAVDGIPVPIGEHDETEPLLFERVAS